MRVDVAKDLQQQNVGEGKGPAEKSSQSSGGQAASADLEILPSQAPLIRQAAASEEVNAEAVAEARQLSESGQLDTEGAARRVAETMLAFGA